MYQIDFKNPVHVYFMGIGGISMSGLAQILIEENFKISGSDNKESDLTRSLEKRGVTVFYGQKAENIAAAGDIDVVVYTAAVHPDNPEFMAAQEAGIPMLTRAELLGQIMKQYELPVAVAGTHGKTTTTSMLSKILLEADTDPTLSIGGIFKDINGNIRVGNSEYFVTEACEYTNSFLSFFPKVSIISNIDADHLDFFKDLDDKYLTLKEYKEKNNIPDAEENENESEVVDSETGETISGGETENADAADGADEPKEPEQSTVYYVTDEVQQAQYISMFRAAKKDAVILRHAIDSAFITQLEQRNQNLKFARIDAELAEDFVRKTAVKKKDADALTKTFQDALKKERLEIQVSNMKDKEIAAILTLSEESRRMMDMMKMYGMDSSAMGGYGASETLVLNAAHPLVKYILANPDSQNVPIICEQLYDLAALSHKPLTQEEMTKFVRRSNEIMVLLTK